MTNNISIRGASRDDATDLAALLTRLGYPTDPASVIARLGRLEATGLDQVFVAEDQDRVVGLASLHIVPALLTRAGPVARVTALVVDAAWEGRGVERRLLAAIEELARTAGCGLIELAGAAALRAAAVESGYAQAQELLQKELA